jgi:ABC-2 type transport system ATP-binding protein
MSSSAIEVQAVTKSFRRRKVLDELSFTVARGKTFAFLGRNAAGKTTTIRLLLGLLARDDGAIRVLGMDPAKEPLALRARVGYLAEDQTMYGWMRVGEIIRFVAPFYATWDHDLALKFARQFELPLDAKIRHLSKGQSVRLGLVLALAHRPELVILDDPALGLDPIMRRQFNRDLVEHLQAEGATIFYSSHLLDEVEPVADEVAILDGGRILCQSDTETLRESVKQFVIPTTAAAVLNRFKCLDVQRAGDEVGVVVDRAPFVSDQLVAEDISFRTNDLNLDEIFAAYVDGHPLDSNTSINPSAQLV